MPAAIEEKRAASGADKPDKGASDARPGGKDLSGKPGGGPGGKPGGGPGGKGGAPDKPLTKLQIAGLIIGIVVGLVVWFMPSFWGLSAEGQHFFAILLMCMVFWFTSPIPGEFTALLLIALPFLLGIVDIKTAFNGFAGNTTWFIFGALLCGKIVSTTGLDKRVAFTIMSKMGRFGSSFKGIMLSIYLVAFVATFVIPSGTVMVTLLCALFFPFISAFGVDEKSNIGKALMMFIVFIVVTNGRMILTGSNFNMVVSGILTETAGQSISWLNWLIAMAPACILVCFMMYGAFITILKPEKVAIEGGAELMKQKVSELGVMSAQEKKAAILFGAALLFWVTGQWTGISVTVVAIAVALISMLPRIGVFNFRQGIMSVPWPILIFTAAVMGLPSIMSAVGINEVFNMAFSSLTANTTSGLVFLFIVWALTQIGCWLGLSMATPAIMLPVLLPLASTFGVPEASVIFVCTLCAPMVMFYHGPHPLIASGYGTFEQKDFIKFGFIHMAAWIPVILIMWYGWWPLLANLGVIF